MNENNKVDLLNPAGFFRQNYAHQLRQTIEAYSTSMIVVGEALQNAIDAICERHDRGFGEISLEINFDEESVTVTDNGNGFPKNISLLYLGGGTKGKKKLKGKVGVGIKVALFSSEYFCVRSNLGAESWKIELENSYNFDTLDDLFISDPLPEDPSPLDDVGTSIHYRFPKNLEGDSNSYLVRFINEVVDFTLPKGIDSGFGKTIRDFSPSDFPSPFCTLLASFLRRYSYVGDVLDAIDAQDKYPLEGIEIDVSLICSDPAQFFGSDIGALYGDQKKQKFKISPKYLKVEDTLGWIPKGKRKPMLFKEKLGEGGTSIERTDGFNSLVFKSSPEYESLLINSRGNLPLDTIEQYRKRLFNKINGISLTIGRIPDFEKYLPGGSRRVISCNGVVTSHDIDLTRGRNQEYVRCFDLVVDLDAQLNYGKTQLTNNHLVKLVRDYINEIYVHSVQRAAGSWVGKMPQASNDDDTDIYVGRKDLGLSNYSSQKEPRDENDVIGLFFEMIGKRDLEGYKLYGLSQKDRYDCRAVIRREADTDAMPIPADDSKLRVVEFKVKADEIIRDFDKMQKFSRDVDLVIAWEIGNYNSKNHEIYDIDQSDAYKASPKQVFPGVTRFIYDAKTGTEVQILLLEDVANELSKSE